MLSGWLSLTDFWTSNSSFSFLWSLTGKRAPLVLHYFLREFIIFLWCLDYFAYPTYLILTLHCYDTLRHQPCKLHLLMEFEHACYRFIGWLPTYSAIWTCKTIYLNMIYHKLHFVHTYIHTTLVLISLLKPTRLFSIIFFRLKA